MARSKHVVRVGDQWGVKTPNKQQPDSLHATQAAAEASARNALRQGGGGELITHGRDGQIRSKDTIAPGNDPNPPRDKEH